MSGSGPQFLRGNYTDLFGTTMLPVLEEIFRTNMMQHPQRREELFKIVSTDRDIWQSTELHDMQLLMQLSEGQEYTFAAPPQGAHKTLTPNKYGLGFSISEEAVDDGKFAFIADAVSKMAKSARESQEIQAMATFNNGATTVTTADGVSLFNASHTLPSGGTFRNVLSSPANLSNTSLEQALIDFETQFVGDSGIIYKVQPQVLLVHPNNKHLAYELTKSQLRPATVTNSTTGITNVNNINSLREIDGLRVVSSPHLTDIQEWYLLAAPAETGLRVISRKPIETKAGGPEVGFINDSILYKCRYREIIGAIHAYGAFSGGV